MPTDQKQKQTTPTTTVVSVTITTINTTCVWNHRKRKAYIRKNAQITTTTIYMEHASRVLA